MSTNNIFRIHPAIGIARVGNSEEYYLGPETMAGMEGENPGDPMGGLPIKPGQETQTITSDDLRDANGLLKRQAARFKIYAYGDDEIQKYPTGVGTEIKKGTSISVNGVVKEVETILWQVHLANKKANSWIEPEQGVSAYEGNITPLIRNPKFPGSAPMDILPGDRCSNSQEILSETARREKLVIDAGPHVIKTGENVKFDGTSQNQYISMGEQGPEVKNVNYPRQFPAYPTTAPANEVIDTLGEMHTDNDGRLIVLGGYGKASGFEGNGVYSPDVPLEEAVNNDGWFDDTSDGPVEAVILFKDGTFHQVEGSAWVVTSDPSYAPQVPNVVSLWEDLYNTWVENMELEPAMYDPNATTDTPVSNPAFALGKGYNLNYKPDYENQIRPILNAAHLQMWATNLVANGQGAHDTVAQQPMEGKKWVEIMNFMRNPNLSNNENQQNGTRMPLSLGDSVIDDPSNPNSRVQDFLAISRTQYFLMYNWLINDTVTTGTPIGAGEKLDRNVLGNCLGGRFSPGIEMTFIIRDVDLYQNWKDGNNYNPAGPFRINGAKMNYANLATPALEVGYTPTHKTPVEPGDICKFMSIPWHTDYNSCATHETGNTDSNMTYWSWPAQRPVAVYTYDDVACNASLDFQRYSVRGEGTNAYWKDGVIVPYEQGLVSSRVGRFQEYIDFVKNWHNVGVVMQGTNINQEGKQPVSIDLIKDFFLEVESNFVEDESNKVVPGPIPANQAVAPPEPKCPHAAKYMKKD